MTVFLRLTADKEKAQGLLQSCVALRTAKAETRIFEVEPAEFRAIPGAPFAYWASHTVRKLFKNYPPFECDDRTARQGLSTAEDFRFVRAWWENPGSGWYCFAKGGAFSPYYADVYLMANWKKEGAEVKAGICKRYPYLNGNADFVAKNPQFYLRPGITWPRRTNGLSLRIMPADCIFADKGPAAFVADDNALSLLALCAIMNSKAFGLLVSVQLARAELAQSFEVGLIQQTPVPEFRSDLRIRLSELAQRAWSLKRNADSIKENSHAYILPAALRPRLGNYAPHLIADELTEIQREIDDIAFALYEFEDADCAAANSLSPATDDELVESEKNADGTEDEDRGEAIDQMDGLLSWAVGVAFGRFDWRLATGEREVQADPGPFDPLPAKSPGMLTDPAEQFHVQDGILVEDQGHPHDLPRLMEEVLARVEVDVPGDVRRWLKRDFFTLHLKQYSKSRRKAPIYWPLSTMSGSYALWIYYPSISSQTLYSAVNDFVEPKLKQVSREIDTLRGKGAARSRDDEKSFEALQALELELIELRDTLLQIAPSFHPNHDDGVQITAAPLWRLFGYKPWQKVLKDTWAKLQKGEYDWSHFAMANWPDRVREKCKTDKSLAIAHDLEELYIEPEPRSPKSGKLKKDTE